jgi:hypothetical protein
VLTVDRSQNFAELTAMQNHGIATFFDAAAARYFSLLYLYTPIQATYGWNFVEPGGATLLHIGTGSGEFEKTIGLDEINRFIGSIKNNPDPTACTEWIKDAFAKVSVVAEGVGKEAEFLLSTRSEPAFRTFANDVHKP